MLQYVAITPIIPQSCASHAPIMCPYRCQLEAMAARALCHPRGWSCEHHNLGHGRCQTRSLSVPALEFRGSGPSSRPLCPNQSSGYKYWIHTSMIKYGLVQLRACGVEYHEKQITIGAARSKRSNMLRGRNCQSPVAMQPTIVKWGSRCVQLAQNLERATSWAVRMYTNLWGTFEKVRQLHTNEEYLFHLIAGSTVFYCVL